MRMFHSVARENVSAPCSHFLIKTDRYSGIKKSTPFKRKRELKTRYYLLKTMQRGGGENEDICNAYL